ncbi:SH3 domain-containing protein [Crassisporium funariophilum]|nr:SH3 domain-containing protein [Crassisporium funariophilum]
MSPQDPENAALVAHIVSQIEQNVQFLASQNYISQGDASAILTKLPNVNQANTHSSSGMSELASRVSNMVTGNRGAPAPAPRPVPAVPSAIQARALWAYNEHGQDSEDLSFAAGDIIEIVEETNADWYMGRAHGKQGLFPSTYVEKLAQPAPQMPVPKSGKPYKPFGAAYHGTNAPPPAGQGVNSVGLQEQEGTEAKKDKFGKYKSTLAHSAVGGAGFGAGAAIGGGLVRAIF